VALALELGALDVSLVDAAPRELLLVTLEGLGGAVALGNTLGTPFQAVALRLASIQVGGVGWVNNCGGGECGEVCLEGGA
jgi:hypothetical protein